MAGLRQLGIGFAGNASDLWTTPYPQALGDRARDKNGNEYLFVDFQVTGASIGSVVGIDLAYRARPLDSTHNACRVGVVVAASPTTNQAGWVQIYGFALVQSSGGLAAGAASVSESSDTSTAKAIVPTTVATSPLGAIAVANIAAATSIEQTSVETAEIFGMWPAFGEAISDYPTWDGSLSSFDHMVTGLNVTQVSDTSGAVTNTTNGISLALVPVILNYPYYLNSFRTISTATS